MVVNYLLRTGEIIEVKEILEKTRRLEYRAIQRNALYLIKSTIEKKEYLEAYDLGEVLTKYIVKRKEKEFEKDVEDLFQYLMNQIRERKGIEQINQKLEYLELKEEVHLDYWRCSIKIETLIRLKRIMMAGERAQSLCAHVEGALSYSNYLTWVSYEKYIEVLRLSELTRKEAI